MIRLRRLVYFRRILMDIGFARWCTAVGSEAFARTSARIARQEMRHTMRKARLDS